MITVTPDVLRRLAPAGKADLMQALAGPLTREFAAGGLTTELRAAHFLAQAAHETDGFRTLEEYGGAAYFGRYDGRKDLGNTQPGDGARFHGRGIFQLTGRANYARFGTLIGLDLISAPSRAAGPDVSVRTAIAYWGDRKLSPLADRDDLAGITKRINGGTNGLADRKAKLIRAKTALQGRSAEEAVAEIKQEALRSQAAARTAGAAGAVVSVPSVSGVAAQPELVTDGHPLAVGAAFLIVAGAIAFLAWRAQSKSRDAKVFAADAALGTGAPS